LLLHLFCIFIALARTKQRQNKKESDYSHKTDQNETTSFCMQQKSFKQKKLKQHQTMTKFRTTLLALFSTNAVMTVTSFGPSAASHRFVLSPSAIFQSSITADCRSLTDQSIPDETNSRLEKVGNVYAPSTAVASPIVVDKEEKLAEIRAMSLIELKLQCSRRNIMYYKFSDREDFVQAIWSDMKELFKFSATGMLRPGMVTDITGEQLDQEMTRSDSLILVDVYATWCGPCKMVVPQLEGAAKQLDCKVRVVKLDSDKNAPWAGRYHVQGLPTMLLIKDGLVVDRLEGAHMTESIVQFVSDYL
jgi:thioredoxin 2